MMYTEDEAKKLWRPFARAASDIPTHAAGYVTANRKPADGSPDIDCYCLASRCMAWRWWGTDVNKIVKGFCGLSGQP